MIMKRFLFFALAALMSLSAVCQDINRTDSKGRRQGTWMDFYPNGQKRYEGEFKNDKCKGTFRYYDEQGNLQATNEFDKSGEKCLNKTYASNGRMIATGYYVNQKKEGEWKYFDKNSGQLLLSEDNKNGRCMVGRDSTTRTTANSPKRRNMLKVSPKACATSIPTRASCRWNVSTIKVCWTAHARRIIPTPP